MENNQHEERIETLMREWRAWVDAQPDDAHMRKDDGYAFSDRITCPKLLAGFHLCRTNGDIGRALTNMDADVQALEDEANWLWSEPPMGALRILYELYPFRNPVQQKRTLARIDCILTQLRNWRPSF